MGGGTYSNYFNVLFLLTLRTFLALFYFETPFSGVILEDNDVRDKAGEA